MTAEQSRDLVANLRRPRSGGLLRNRDRLRPLQRGRHDGNRLHHRFFRRPRRFLGFGLLSVQTLAQELRVAHAAGRDIAAADVLARYERCYMLATWPLYEITGLIARLYTTDTTPARVLRDAALHVAQRLTPFKRLVAASLAGNAAYVPAGNLGLVLLYTKNHHKYI